MPSLGIGLGHLGRIPGGGASLPSGALGVWKMGSYATSPRPYVPNSLDSTAARVGLGPPARRNFANSQFWAANNLTVTDSNATGPDGLSEASTVVSSSASWYMAMNGTTGAASWLPIGTYTLAINVRWKGTGTTDFKMGAYPSGLITKTASASWQRFTVTLTTTNTSPFLVWLYTPDGTSAANFEICNAELFSGSSDLGPEPISSHIYFHKLTSGAANPSLSAGLLDPTANNAGFIQFASSTSFGPMSLVWTGKLANSPFNESFQPIIANMAPQGSWANFVVNEMDPLRISSTTLGAPNAPAQWDSLNRGVSTICVTYDGSTTKVYVNGILLLSKSGSASASAIKDLYFSRLAQSYYSGYTLGAFALYARALTSTEVATATSVLGSYVAGNGSASGPTRVVFFEGDSITVGSGATAPNNSYAAKAASTASPVIRTGNLAQGGSTMTNLNARAATLDSYLPANKAGVTYVLHILVGTNDMTNTPSAPGTFTSALATYIAARKAAGWDKIVVGTIIARSEQADGGAQFNIDRATANATIRGWVGSTIDVCADYAANTLVGADGASNNTTYFMADKIHPIDAGHAQMYPITTAAINPLWGY